MILVRRRAEHDQFPLVADFVEPEDVHAIVIRSDFEFMGSSARGSARSVAGPVLAANIYPRLFSAAVCISGDLMVIRSRGRWAISHHWWKCAMPDRRACKAA